MSLSAVSFSRSACDRGVPIYIMGACTYVICTMAVCVLEGSDHPTEVSELVCDEACIVALQRQIARHTRRSVSQRINTLHESLF